MTLQIVYIITVALILFFLIGFNYLLWDKENKQGDIETLRYANDSNSDYIDYLKSQISSLEQDNKSFRTNINYLEADLSRKDSELEGLKRDKQALNKNILQYKDDLTELASQVDLEILRNIINQWAEYINKNNAKGAYDIFHTDIEKKGLAYRDFSLAVAGIETIEIISVEKIENNEEKKPEPGVTVLKALLNVAGKEEAENTQLLFDRGKVEVILEMGFNQEEHRWCIMTMEQKTDQSPSPGHTPSPTGQ